MIRSKQELHNYIACDLGQYMGPFKYIFEIVRLKVTGNENYRIVRLLYALRHYEYYYNKTDRTYFDFILKSFWNYRYRQCELAANIYIGFNVTGKGLHIVHPGFRHLHTVPKIGENCTILPMVLIGKKYPNTEAKAIIGNNCYISTGVTILAPIVIGNNVTIGAGAVVTKDIPDNAIVAGVPARIIGKNDTMNNDVYRQQ